MNDFPCERVLIVDDNPDLLQSMRDVLELEGAEVATATSRQDSDEVLSDGFDPNVIIIDVRLGSDRGDEYASALRASRPTTRIVLMSGDPHALRRHAPDVDAILPKPFHIDRLIQLVSDRRSPERAIAAVGRG